MSRSLTRLLAPLGKTKSKNVSELLTSHGFIHQTGSGLYDLLPLGLRVQNKIEAIVRKHLDKAGCDELALTTQINPDLWRQSGRLGEQPSPEFAFTGDNKYLLTPTGEEQITSLVGSVSYRQLPLKLYQITRKFRNELRPRGGLLRTREFLMKDLYSFDVDMPRAHETYHQVFEAYNAIFKEIGVPFISVQADSGDMGGDMSHEFHYETPIGDDHILSCGSCGFLDKVERIGPKDTCPSCDAPLDQKQGIEVGHTFYLGTRYTDPLKTKVTLSSGETVPIHMGCYGIGITRLIQAISEKQQDEHGLIWPLSVAPFTACVIGRDHAIVEAIADGLSEQGIEAVYDDRTTQIGHAMRAGRESGWPFLVIVGRAFAETGEVEVQRRGGETALVPKDCLAEYIRQQVATQLKEK